MPPHIGPPVIANFDARHLLIASGAVIFHLKSERVVLCYHTRDNYYFLPKGRRDANEESGSAAEREGFEESGYANRLLPLPVDHRQPIPHGADRVTFTPFTTEPVWTQLVPLSSRRQYLLFWYICETLPPDDEAAWLLGRTSIPRPRDSDVPLSVQKAPVPPKPYPSDLTIEERVEMEGEGWEPTRTEGTGVDDEEACYVAALHPVPRALQLLKGSLGVEIVKQGWELIQLRKEMEKSKSQGKQE